MQIAKELVSALRSSKEKIQSFTNGKTALCKPGRISHKSLKMALAFHAMIDENRMKIEKLKLPMKKIVKY